MTELEKLRQEYNALGERIAQLEKKPTAKEFFLSFFNGSRMGKLEKYPESWFWFNEEGKFLFELNKKYSYFFISWPLIWSKLESEYGLNDEHIKELTSSALEEELKIKGFAAHLTRTGTAYLLEEEFKMNGFAAKPPFIKHPQKSV